MLSRMHYRLIAIINIREGHYLHDKLDMRMVNKRLIQGMDVGFL